MLVTENKTFFNFQDLINQFKNIRQLSVDICKPLEVEDYVVQPEVFVSPPKWHLAHTTWFFETFILRNYKENYQEFHKDFNYLFNSYYESVGERTLRVNRGNITRPTVRQILAYREYVNEQMLELLNTITPTKEFRVLLEIGLHHEQQHQELLYTDIKYILGHNPTFPTYLNEKPQIDNSSQNDLGFYTVEEGLYTIGYQGGNFFFDNEKGVHQVFLQKFDIANRVVTNEEYLEFIEANAYQNFKYWLSDGWAWVNENQVKAPLYWHKIEGEWYYYTFFGLEKLDLKAPVTHINHYEADAFATWKGMRLPTEFEWEVACQQFAKEISPNANLLEKNNLKPIPQQSNENQFWGDVWEWTNSAYLPYPKYKRAEGALGEYNGKFMNGQMVLRGGSCITSTSHIRHTYRNFFYSNERWQFTGIRLAI